MTVRIFKNEEFLGKLRESLEKKAAEKKEETERIEEVRSVLRGSEVISEVKVLANDFAEYKISAKNSDAHAIASQLEKNRPGVIIQNIQSQHIAGLDISIGKRAEIFPGVHVKRKEIYWTNARGIVLPTAEAHARVFGSCEKNSLGSFSHEGEYTSANVEVYSNGKNSCVQVNAWTEKTEVDTSGEKKISAHEFMYELRPTEAQKKFRQIVTAGKNLPKVNRENAFRQEYEAEQEKISEKKAREEKILAKRPEAPTVEMPKSPEYFARPCTDNARMVNFEDLVSIARRKLIEPPIRFLSEEAEQAIKNCECEIKRLKIKLKPLAREVKKLRAQAEAKTLVRWGKRYVFPEVLLKDRAEKARQIREEIALEKKRIEGIRQTGLPC